MHKLKTIILENIIFFIMLRISLNSVEGRVNMYGAPCNATKLDDDCNGIQNLYCSHEKQRCECDKFSTLRYTEDAFPYCQMSVEDIGLRIFGRCPNLCEKGQYCSSHGYCECKNNNVSVSKGGGIKCYEEMPVSPMEPCFIKDKAYICDIEKLSYCKNSTCECFEGYVYNNVSATCVKSDNLGGEYNSNRISWMGKRCSYDIQCDGGLECIHSICACPGSCSYFEEHGICSCVLSRDTDIILSYFPFFMCFLAVAVFASFSIFQKCRLLRMSKIRNDSSEIELESRRFPEHRNGGNDGNEEEEIEPLPSRRVINIEPELARIPRTRNSDRPPTYWEAIRGKNNNPARR